MSVFVFYNCQVLLFFSVKHCYCFLAIFKYGWQGQKHNLQMSKYADQYQVKGFTDEINY